MTTGPLLVFGPNSVDFDFGPRHPLSPRRFGPGIDLLRAVGAEAGLAPEPAADEELAWLHAPDYIATVRRFSAEPGGEPEVGIGPGDCPPFAGMHDASAAVAGGSIRAMEAILRGDVEHAYQPGGGLHHAMRARASGFCIYNDVALAIARARRDSLRVLYIDLDVHHGDGVQALHYSDPGVMTISFHESGRSLFPGTGFVWEVGEGAAAGTSINVPFEPSCGPDSWLTAVRAVIPPLAASFGPDVIVSQHGCDGHVWDPLAHLALTTTAIGAAARLVDQVAHRNAGGRWLATGGGGYSVYRVVPRAWALTWLAGAHRDVPAKLPEQWLARWAGEAARWDDSPLPDGFEDEPGLVGSAPAGMAAGRGQGLARLALREAPDRARNEAAAERARETVLLVRTVLLPALLSVAESRGWWRFDEGAADSGPSAAPAAEAPPASRATPGRGAAPIVLVPLTPAQLDSLSVAPGVLAVADVATATAILRAALLDGAVATAAVSGEWLVAAALATPSPVAGVDRLVALGVAPEWRRAGLATSLLRALVDEQDRRGRAMVALHTVAERDPMDPLPRAVRRGVAESVATTAGMSLAPAPLRIAEADPGAFIATHLPPGVPPGLALAVGEWVAGL